MMMEQNCNVRIPGTQKHMEHFAVAGLRTLVVASKEIGRQSLRIGSRIMQLHNRQKSQQNCEAAAVGARYEYVGVAAIEDKRRKASQTLGLRAAGLQVRCYRRQGRDGGQYREVLPAVAHHGVVFCARRRR